MTVMDGMFFLKSLAWEMLLYKWAAMHQYPPSHSPNCFYFYWTVRALSFGTSIGGHHVVSSFLKTQPQNAKRGYDPLEPESQLM